ncbi:vhaAC45-related protein [Musca autumnalis]|uniref:vhaAC45-related protein n=1 Tax=Musca autumnalis TaxID=221902 RepID=UPI003CEC4D56
MKLFYLAALLGLVTLTTANINGPYLFWGHEKVINLQPRALQEASENHFSDLFRDAKAIVIFVRNSTKRLDGQQYPKFQQLIRNNGWSYLPQHSLLADPFNYNANIEVINLSGPAEESDSEIVGGYTDALSIYGEGEVLGILASREEDAHFIAKRAAAVAAASEGEGDEGISTTASPGPEEYEDNYIYVANGRKAVLNVNAAPELTINQTKLLLKEHTKEITFDDQRSKHYGRLSVIFKVDDEKVTLRFNFSVKYGTWAMKAVEVRYKEYETVLQVVGRQYDIPSAPLKFSYRCSARHLQFTNGNDTLVLKDYQVQPWLDGAERFGDVYDCIGFTTAPIWAGVLVSLFLVGILSIGILALMDIKTPNRFESSRSKQLTFTVQE